MKEAIPWGRRKEPGARVELASSCWGRVELASSCWERGCAHFLHKASSVSSGASNSPRGQGHETLYVPVTATTAVQRPDAIMREKDGAGCGVVLILVAGFWRNGRKEEEEAMLRKV